MPKTAVPPTRLQDALTTENGCDGLAALLREIDAAEASGAQVERLLTVADAGASDAVLARCALAMAIERQHAARETFVGLAAMNNRMLADGQTSDASHDHDPIVTLMLAIGEFLAALYTPEAADRLGTAAMRLLALVATESDATAHPDTLARLRLRAASALLGYAELKDSTAVRTQIDNVAADASTLLADDHPDVIDWWAERAAVACYALGREKHSDAPLRAMLAQQSERLGGRTRQQTIAAFKWWRVHLEIARYAQDVAAQDEAFDGIARTIAPRRRAQLLTFLRVKAHVYVYRGRALEAERLARDALEVATEIAAPASDEAAAINVLAASLILQERWHDAIEALQRIEGRNHGRIAQFLGAIRLLIASVACWDSERGRSVELLQQGFAANRALLNYGFLVAAPALAARLAARALACDIESEFVTEAIRRRNLASPSRSQEQWPWVVRLKLFGGFACESAAATAKPGSKAQQRPIELLQALVLIGPAGGDRREVSRRLYGSADAIAPVTLDMNVARARKLLGDDSLIVFEQGRLRLDQTRVFADVWAFDAIDGDITALLPGGAQTEPTVAEMRRLAQAMTALYGGTLLHGETTDIATHTLVQRYRERFVANAMRLASALATGGADGDARELLHRAIEREPDSEALYRALIERLIEEDELAEAKRWYERCETMTRQRFGVEVSKRTRTLLDRMHTPPGAGRASGRRATSA